MAAPRARGFDEWPRTVVVTSPSGSHWLRLRCRSCGAEQDIHVIWGCPLPQFQAYAGWFCDAHDACEGAFP